MTAEERTQWEARRDTIQARCDRIIIPPDITPGISKNCTAAIDALLSEINYEYGKILHLKDKTDSIIYNTQLLAADEGRNEASRKANGIRACEAYEENGQTIDLYSRRDDIMEQYYFYNRIINTLDGKSNRLILMNGLMKLESNVI